MERTTLRPHEHVNSVIRRHVVMLIGPLVFLFILLLVDVFFMPQLFRAGTIGLILFLAVAVMVLVSAWRAYVVWHSTHLIVTNQRVIDVDRRGFFSWTVSEVDFAKMQDVTVERDGLLDMMLGTGSIEILGAGHLRLEVSRIPGALAEREKLLDAQDVHDRRAEKEDDDEGVVKVDDLPEDERRAVGKYVNHLRSKRALEEFSRNQD